MAMSGDDAGYYAEVQRIFSKIMEGYKVKTGSRYGTALLIANCAGTPEEADELVDRTKRIFERTALNGESPEAVAASFKMTRHAVDQAKSRAMARLRELVKELESVYG